MNLGFAGLVALLAAPPSLPDHPVSPGAGRFSLSLGADDPLAPILGARWGVVPWMAVHVSVELRPDAPLLEAEIDLAAGRLKKGSVVAHAYLLGHLRPSLDSDLLAGADLGGGIGLMAFGYGFVLDLTGGIQAGFPVTDARTDASAIDQRGGWHALERLSLGWAITSSWAIELLVGAGFPLGELPDEARADVSLVDTWEFRWGGRALWRF